MKTKQVSVALFISVFLLFYNQLFGQAPKKYFDADSINEDHYAALKKEFGKYKKMPASIEKPVLVALSYYPELKDTHIRFRIKKRHTPLQTRASWIGLFKRKEVRDYVITISDTTEPMLALVLFKNV